MKTRSLATLAAWSSVAAGGLLALLMLISPVSAFADPEPGVAFPPVKKKYRRSKLTNDESEMTADRRKLRLTTGEDRAVDLDFDVNGGAAGVTVGNPQTLVTTLVKIGDKRQIVFKPLKKGETTITLRDADGVLRLIFEVTVTENNLMRRASEIRDLLRDIEGIDVRVVGQRVVIDGEVFVPGDYARLLLVANDEAFKGILINLAFLSPLAMQVLAKKIQEDVVAFAPNVKTRVVNGMIFLEGTVEKIEDARRAAEVAKLYLPDSKPGGAIPILDKNPQNLPPRSLIQNFILVNAPPPKRQDKLVRVTVHFVELSKNYLKNFGFKWQPGFSAPDQITVGTAPDGSAASSGFNFSATISNLFPRLSSAQSAGYARILKTATIITRNGQSAEVNEQTQIPVVTMGQNGVPTTSFIPVGLAVNVIPKILGQSEDIELNLNLNQINATDRAPGSAPATSNHKIVTSLYVKNNESAAVGGVLSGDVRTDFNGQDPNAGSFQDENGPLWTLLRSKRFEKKKSQFVIFVTPQILENPSEGTEDLQKNFRIKVK